MNIDDLLRSAIASYPQIRIAFVFGSMAQGGATQDSDVDVAIAADGPLSSEFKQQLIGRIAAATNRPVDLVDLQTAGEPIRTQVLTKGRLLLCTNRRLYAELIKRMVFDHADFLPYRTRILSERRATWTSSSSKKN